MSSFALVWNGFGGTGDERRRFRGDNAEVLLEVISEVGPVVKDCSADLYKRNHPG